MDICDECVGDLAEVLVAAQLFILARDGGDNMDDSIEALLRGRAQRASGCCLGWYVEQYKKELREQGWRI